MVSYATSRVADQLQLVVLCTIKILLIQTAKNLVETGDPFSKEYQTIHEAKDRDMTKRTKPDVVSSLNSSEIF